MLRLTLSRRGTAGRGLGPWLGLALAGSLVGGCNFDPSGAGGGDDDVAPDAAGDLTDAASGPDAPPGTRRLTVTVTGSGQVTSSPPGINCSAGGTSCVADFDDGVSVTLTASPANFIRWGGACDGLAGCAVTLDQDRAVTAGFPAPAPVAVSEGFGSGNADAIEAVAAIGATDVIIGGQFADSDFVLLADPGDFGGNTDAYVARVNAGGVVWSTTFGDAGGDVVRALAVDAAGDVYLAGSIAGDSPTIAGCAAASTAGSSTDADVIVAKLDGDSGACLWADRMPSQSFSQDHGLGIAVSGDVVAVTGSFSGTLLTGPGNNTLTTAGNDDIFVVLKSAVDGATTARKRFGGQGNDAGRGAAFAPGGTLHVAGNFFGNVNFGGDTVNGDNTDGIHLELAANLDVLEHRQLSGNGQDAFRAVAVAGDGGVALAGEYEDTATFGGVTLPVGNNSNACALVLHAGVVDVTAAWPTDGTDRARGVAWIGNTDIMVVGEFGDDFDFGLGQILNAGGADLFAVRLDDLGHPVWVLTAGSQDNDLLRAVSSGQSGVWLGGLVGDVVDLGLGAITYDGGASDGLLVRVAP